MRYFYLLFIILSLSISPLWADKRSEQILDDVGSTIDSYGRYEVNFEVVNGGSVVVDGRYIVDGEIFKLDIANQEIYGDSQSRFTIDNGSKEVVMESIDSSLSIVIANPARAFKALKRGFDSRIVAGENSESIYVTLTPRKEDDLLDSALLEVDPQTKLPLSIQYTSGGETITVKILGFEKSSTSLHPLVDMALPDDYDVIDIR